MQHISYCVADEASEVGSCGSKNRRSMEVMEVGEVIARGEVNFGVAPSHAPLRVLRLMPAGHSPLRA
mgnify:CR=1 FL=1